MSAYCTISDLYDFGLQRGSFANPARLLSSVDISANTLTLDVHGFALNDPITFRDDTSGGVLPAPIVAGTTFFAVPVDENSFSIAATSGGAVINLTAVGSSPTRTLVIAKIPFDSAIQWASDIIENELPAHIVPLVAPFHTLIVATTAELAVGKLLSRTGSASISIGDMIDKATKRVERWAKGIPLRGDNVPEPANEAASATVPYRDVRGWAEFGGT